MVSKKKKELMEMENPPHEYEFIMLKKKGKRTRYKIIYDTNYKNARRKLTKNMKDSKDYRIKKVYEDDKRIK